MPATGRRVPGSLPHTSKLMILKDRNLMLHHYVACGQIKDLQLCYKSFVTWFTNGCNTAMSQIKNSVCPLIDQRPKAVPGDTFEKVFHTTKPAEYAIFIPYTSP